MSKWPLLVVTIVLVNTVQWTNSIKQHNHNLNLNDILLDLDDDELINQENILQTTSLRSHIYKSSTEHHSNDKELSKTKPGVGSIGTRFAIDNDNELAPKYDEIDECLKNNVYCDELKSYPNKKIIESFDKVNHFKNHFPQKRIHKIKINPNLKSLCADAPIAVYPQAAQLFLTNEWRYIVQGSSFEQGIEIMPCYENGMACRFFVVTPSTSPCCEQEYMSLKLVAINSTLGINYETFKFPSFCRCKYLKNTTD